jgi:hypothetical protein
MGAVQAARISDDVGGHASNFWGWVGLIAGLVVGLVIGAVLLAAVVGSGGLVGALLIASAATGMLAMGGLGAGALGRFGHTFDAPPLEGGSPCSKIVKGLETVEIEHQLAARMTDKVNHNSAEMRQGSETVLMGLEKLPASRVKDLSTCSGKVIKAATFTFIGGPPKDSGKSTSVDSWFNTALGVADWTAKWMGYASLAFAGLAAVAGAAIAGVAAAGVRLGMGEVGLRQLLTVGFGKAVASKVGTELVGAAATQALKEAAIKQGASTAGGLVVGMGGFEAAGSLVVEPLAEHTGDVMDGKSEGGYGHALAENASNKWTSWFGSAEEKAHLKEEQQAKAEKDAADEALDPAAHRWRDGLSGVSSLAMAAVAHKMGEFFSEKWGGHEHGGHEGGEHGTGGEHPPAGPSAEPAKLGADLATPPREVVPEPPKEPLMIEGPKEPLRLAAPKEMLRIEGPKEMKLLPAPKEPCPTCTGASEVVDAAGDAAAKGGPKAEPPPPKATPKDAAAKIQEHYDQFFDAEDTPNPIPHEQVRGNVDAALKDAGASPSLREKLGKMDDNAFDDVVRQNPEKLAKLSSSDNPELSAYAENLAEQRAKGTISSKDYGTALARAEELSSLPKVDNAVSVDKGTGGVGKPYVGELNGQEVFAKADRDPSLSVDSEAKVLDGLQEYGAPKSYGKVRVVDPETGMWREAVAMDKVKGVDLLSAESLSKTGEMPFEITDEHVKSIDALQAKLDANGKHLSETNKGDFILTPDGKVVPIDMFVDDGVRPNGGALDHQGKPIRDSISALKTKKGPAHVEGDAGPGGANKSGEEGLGRGADAPKEVEPPPQECPTCTGAAEAPKASELATEVADKPKEISIFGFRGAGGVNDLLAPDAPHPYSVTGHVGYSFDGGETIYGFGPKVPENMSAFDAVQSLKNKASYPGQVTNDTEVFRSVAEHPLESRGGGLQTVVEQKIPVSQEQFDAIKAQHDAAGVNNPMGDVLYGFPGPDGESFNCATYPSKLGIPIPETSGNLRNYMPALEEKGQPWSPEPTSPGPPAGPSKIEFNAGQSGDGASNDAVGGGGGGKEEKPVPPPEDVCPTCAKKDIGNKG